MANPLRRLAADAPLSPSKKSLSNLESEAWLRNYKERSKMLDSLLVHMLVTMKEKTMEKRIKMQRKRKRKKRKNRS
jgi:hypothetical protein